MDYSEPSNFLTDTADTNPKFGFQSSLPSSNADPGSDQTLELRKELEKKQLYLKEGKGENEEAEPDMVVVEKVYEELEKQLHLKEVEEDNHSIEWNQNDDFNCGESHDGEEGLNKYDKEDDGNDDEKYDDEVEKRDERSNGNRRHHYPVRPEAEDCSYYMKTGTCKFGSNCKFNHPVRRKNQVPHTRSVFVCIQNERLCVLFVYAIASYLVRCENSFFPLMGDFFFSVLDFVGGFAGFGRSIFKRVLFCVFFKMVKVAYAFIVRI